MITKINANHKNWGTNLYISRRLKESSVDDYGNQYVSYENPVLYNFVINTVETSSEVAEFGERVKNMKKITMPITYKGYFREFDGVYVDNNAKQEGSRPDYRMLPPRIGNSIITIYIEKVLGKSDR